MYFNENRIRAARPVNRPLMQDFFANFISCAQWVPVEVSAKEINSTDAQRRNIEKYSQTNSKGTPRTSVKDDV